MRGAYQDAVVRFEPPENITPGLMGALMNLGVRDKDVAATIVDLAVRGHLQMRQVAKDDWELIANLDHSPKQLLKYEQTLLDKLFGSRKKVLLSEMKDGFALSLRKVKLQMAEEYKDRGWSRTGTDGPLDAVAFCMPFIVILVVLVALFLNLNVIAFAAGPTILAIIGWIGLHRERGRSAVGSAMYAQARGFELYLKTAEAKQFTFEEAEAIFSRYMPYAIVLGLAGRWAKLFSNVAAKAQAEGHPLSMPYWYSPDVGTSNIGGAFDGMSHLDSFSSIAADAMSSTPASSGDSGFSGGGGDAGGGISGGW